tara:strand:- start:248 stop:517 length:270 start_codon:yes stop_codon:yes gene_type:complete
MAKGQLIIFHTGGTIVSQIEEIEGADLGEPDCKLVQPFNIVPQSNGNATLEPWMGELTSQVEFNIHSDKILTICEPLGKIQDTYESLTK